MRIFGKRDDYKIDGINEQIEALRKDKYHLAQLSSKNSLKAINLDEGALEVLKKYYEGEEILFGSEYFAKKLWSKEDVESIAEEMGYEPTEELVSEAIKQGSSWNELIEIDDDERNCVRACIKDAAEVLGVEPDRDRDEDCSFWYFR